MGTLVIDTTLPQQPQFFNMTMDAFTDASVYFKELGKKFQPPTSPMRFASEDYNFQFVVSSYSVNQLIDSVMETKIIKAPIKHDILSGVIGMNLTTTIMSVIIPQLLRNYGARPVDMLIVPTTGTTIKWTNNQNKHQAHYATTLDMFIV